jgi:hypothetical protein
LRFAPDKSPAGRRAGDRAASASTAPRPNAMPAIASRRRAISRHESGDWMRWRSRTRCLMRCAVAASSTHRVVGAVPSGEVLARRSRSKRGCRGSRPQTPGSGKAVLGAWGVEPDLHEISRRRDDAGGQRPGFRTPGFRPREAVGFALYGKKSCSKPWVRNPKPQAPMVGSGSAGLGFGGPRGREARSPRQRARSRVVIEGERAHRQGERREDSSARCEPAERCASCSRDRARGH